MSTDMSSPTSAKSTPSNTDTTEDSTPGVPSSSAVAADTAPQNATPTPEETEPQQSEEQPAETEGGGNAEAARYRRRLRDTEAQVEQLTAERDEATRALAELRDAIATEALEGALADRIVDEEMRRIVLDQVSLDDFRTEVGTVDRKAVADYARKFTPPVTGWTFAPTGQDRDARIPRSGTTWSKLLGSE